MQEFKKGLITILSEEDENAISLKVHELMELIWETFHRRRMVMNLPRHSTNATITPNDNDAHNSQPIDLIF